MCLLGVGWGQAGEEEVRGRWSRKLARGLLGTRGYPPAGGGGGGGCCQRRAELGLVIGACRILGAEAGRAWGRELTAGGFWLRI